MGIENNVAQGAPRLVQKAIEASSDEYGRRKRGALLHEEAVKILKRYGWQRETRCFRTKTTYATKVTLGDESGRRAVVAISARKHWKLDNYESDLTRAAIRIEVGDYDTLNLPPPGVGFGGVFPLPEAERLDDYLELLEAARKEIEFLDSLTCL